MRHPRALGGAGRDWGGADLVELLAAARAGDDLAWRQVIELYARRVYGLARSRLGRDDLAEEVTQSVFVTLARKLGSAPGDIAPAGEPAPMDGCYVERGKFESWLFRIAANRVRDEARRLRRHARTAEQGDLVAAHDRAHGSGAGEPGADPADILALRSALGELSEADREVIELRHHAGLSFKQIAELLDEPLGTLLARHHRALKKLKDVLDRDEGPRRVAPAAVPDRTQSKTVAAPHRPKGDVRERA